MSDMHNIILAHQRLEDNCQTIIELARSNNWDEVIVLQGALAESLTEWIELNEQVPITEETGDQRLRLLHSVMTYHKNINTLLEVRRDEIAELLKAADRQKSGAGFGRQIDSGTYEQPRSRRRL